MDCKCIIERVITMTLKETEQLSPLRAVVYSVRHADEAFTELQ